jgi:hypothetical protein
MRARPGSGRSPHGWDARTPATACRAACRAACMWQARRGISRLSQAARQVELSTVAAVIVVCFQCDLQSLRHQQG